jgi:transposase
MKYSPERKAAVMKQLLPPHNRSVPEVAEQEGISTATLYNWRHQARQQGVPVPGSKGAHEDWSAEAKFATVLETAGLSEAELSEYCRERGLYPEQIQAWREACKSGVDGDEARRREQQRQSQASRRRIRELEQEVNRKDKALAETTALLALRKKLQALWGDDNEDD